MNDVAQEAQAQVAVERGVESEVAALKAASSDFERAKALAALSILLPQLTENKIPAPLEAELAYVVELLDASNPSVQAGACAVLTGVMANEEALWRRLTSEGISAKLMNMLGGKPESVGLQINILSALASVAEGGDEGAHALVEAGLEPVMEACSSHAPENVLEGVTDLCCVMATTPSCREGMSKAGAVPALAGVLGIANLEVQARALMGLGMLLPSSPDNQRALASDAAALQQLLALMRQDDDPDIKIISRDLFTGLAKSCKDEVAAAMRAGAQA